jgi:hypothetical protein
LQPEAAARLHGAPAVNRERQALLAFDGKG